MAMPEPLFVGLHALPVPALPPEPELEPEPAAPPVSAVPAAPPVPPSVPPLEPAAPPDRAPPAASRNSLESSVAPHAEIASNEATSKVAVSKSLIVVAPRVARASA
jgi:hypothetical protein